MAEKVCLVTRILHATVDNKENYAREILNKQLANCRNGLSKEVEDIYAGGWVFPMPTTSTFIRRG